MQIVLPMTYVIKEIVLTHVGSRAVEATLDAKIESTVHPAFAYQTTWEIQELRAIHVSRN